MSTIVTRAGKGSPLTNTEMDTNLTNLNTDKVEGQAASVDSEIALFSGTGGKTIKRATTTGILKATSGVVAAASAGTDFVAPGGALGTPSSGTLTNCTGLPPSTGLSAAVGVAKGGTGLSTIPAKAVLVTNSLDTVTTVVPGASQSIRRNAGDTAWEAYTPSTGTGDVTGQSSSVDSEIALFSGTGGKTIKRATTTGLLKAASGVIGAAVSGTDIKTINSTSLLGSGDIAVGGTWVYLSTVTASNSATVDIETTFNSTYDSYVLVASGITSSTSSDFRARLKINGTYQTGNNYHYHAQKNPAGTVTYDSVSDTSQAQILVSGVNYDTPTFPGTRGNYVFYIHNPSSTTFYKEINWTGACYNNSGQGVCNVGIGAWKGGTQALTGVRFYFLSGNVVTGTFRLYGIKNS